MKNLFKIIAIFSCACMLCAFTVSCSKCVNHIYAINKTVDATYTSEGYTEYACSKCGFMYQKTIPMLADTPGVETLGTQAVQIVSGNYTPFSGDELPINHYFGYSKEPLNETVIDTRYHGTYHPGTIQYVTQNGAPLPLNLNIPIQEFFSHSVLSISKLLTKDGKTYDTASGFKVVFDFTPTDKNPKDLFAWDKGLSEEFAHLDEDYISKLVKVVGAYPAEEARYKTIYEIVDFSSSYIEIAKKTDDGYITVNKIESEQDWSLLLDIGKFDVSNDNGELFFESGTYRILFKYDMMWVTDSASPVYAAEDTSKSNPLYPYGHINSQYESFYVTVTEEKSTVLLPSNMQTGNVEFFCQLRALSNDTHIPFVSEYSTLNFGDSVGFNIGAKLGSDSTGYLYNKKALSHFYVKVSVYNEDTDTYDEYKSFDLMNKLSKDVVNGREISLDIGKDESVRNKKYKISVLYTVDGVSTQQNYYYTVKW